MAENFSGEDGNTNTAILLVKALPIDFERKEAVSVAKKIGIPQRSADNYLKILVQQGKIIKQTHGSYRKYN